MRQLRGPTQAGAVYANLLPPAALELWFTTGSIGRDFVNVVHAAKRLQCGERVTFSLQGETVFDDIEGNGDTRRSMKNIVFEVSRSTFDVDPYVYWGNDEDDRKNRARLQNAGLLDAKGYPTNALMHESMLDGSALALLVPDEGERRLVFDGLLSNIEASVSIDVIDGETVVFSGSRYDFWKLANDAEYILVQAQKTRQNRGFYYYCDEGPEDQGQFSFVRRLPSVKSDNCAWIAEFYLRALADSTVCN